MATVKIVPFEEVTETRELLERAADHPVIVEFKGRHFRVTSVSDASEIRPTTTEEERAAIWEGYDPEKVQQAMRGLIGTFEGVDTAELKRIICEERGQFSSGRPCDPE